MPELWEGARRLPYFFSYGQPEGNGRRAVMCPQCCLEHIENEPEMLRAHYCVNRSVMCGRCGILIGPANDEEVIEYE
jgi:hypothetical protein